MYQLTDSNLSAIEAWFLQDIPCKNGVSIIELIKTLSASNIQELVVEVEPVVKPKVLKSKVL